ncbi:MAG: metal-dependent hydrolase [Candidatus Aminicenantia bacterium]
MPSPLGHTLFSLSIIRLAGREVLKNKYLILAGLFFGLLPDVDLSLILISGFKEGGKYHQLFTHSIFFAVLVLFSIYVLTKKLKLGLLFAFLTLMHSFLDIFSIDEKPPIGVPIFSPFSHLAINFGILPKIEKSSFSSLFSKNNIYAIIIEISIFLPLYVLVYLLTKPKASSS